MYLGCHMYGNSILIHILVPLVSGACIEQYPDKATDKRARSRVDQAGMMKALYPNGGTIKDLTVN